MANGLEFSLEQSTIRMNGFTFTGWSDDSDALSLPADLEIAKAVRGADGKMIVTSTGEKGGPISFKFLANSPSVSFLQALVTAKLTTGAITIFNGTYVFNTGIIVTVQNGTLVKAPLGPTIGKGQTKNAEYVFEFEKVIAEYITANF